MHFQWHMKCKWLGESITRTSYTSSLSLSLSLSLRVGQERNLVGASLRAWFVRRETNAARASREQVTFCVALQLVETWLDTVKNNNAQQWPVDQQKRKRKNSSDADAISRVLFLQMQSSFSPFCFRYIISGPIKNCEGGLASDSDGCITHWPQWLAWSLHQRSTQINETLQVHSIRPGCSFCTFVSVWKHTTRCLIFRFQFGQWAKREQVRFISHLSHERGKVLLIAILLLLLLLLLLSSSLVVDVFLLRLSCHPLAWSFRIFRFLRFLFCFLFVCYSLVQSVCVDSFFLLHWCPTSFLLRVLDFDWSAQSPVHQAVNDERFLLSSVHWLRYVASLTVLAKSEPLLLFFYGLLCGPLGRTWTQVFPFLSLSLSACVVVLPLLFILIYYLLRATCKYTLLFSHWTRVHLHWVRKLSGTLVSLSLSLSLSAIRATSDTHNTRNLNQTRVSHFGLFFLTKADPTVRTTTDTDIERRPSPVTLLAFPAQPPE